MVKANQPCVICGVEHNVIYHRQNVAKYCSRSCYYRAMHLVGSVIIQCKQCSKDFRTSPSRDKKYCSKRCYGISEYAPPAKYGSGIRKKLKRLNLLTQCLFCGYGDYPEILEIHHIDHNRDNNKWSNLTIICPNCHKRHHFSKNMRFPSLEASVAQAISRLTDDDFQISRNGHVHACAINNPQTTTVHGS